MRPSVSPLACLALTQVTKWDGIFTQALVLATDADKLMLYPHVLLSCVALLPLPSSELFTCTLPLLLTVLPPCPKHRSKLPSRSMLLSY